MSATTMNPARLDMGAVASQTFGIVQRNILAIGGIALIVSALIFALSYGMGLLIGYEGSQAGLDSAARVGLGGAVGGILGLLVSPIAVGGITMVAIADLNERRIGLGPALANGVRLMFPLFGLTFVATLAVSLASLLLVIPGIILLLRWFVATPVRVVEGPGIGAALARSRDLTVGSRWRLLGLFVVYFVLAAIVQFGLHALVAAVIGGMPAPVQITLTALSSVLSSTILSAISSTGLAVCYMQLRSLREGATPSQLAAVFA